MEKSSNVPIRALGVRTGTYLMIIIFVVYSCLQIWRQNLPFLTNEAIYQMRMSDSHSVAIDRRPTLHPETKHLHVGSKAMVSSDVPICSKMGKEILLKGGNAADAAVTVALCIGSVNSASSGIGGGGFILSSLDGKDTISIDAREMAPGKSFTEMYEDNPILATIGGLANGVPGELKGLDTLYKLHGSGNLTWAQLIEPVIKLNREGFEVGLVVQTTIDVLLERYKPLFPSVLKNWDFIYNEDGSSKKIGDIIKRPNLANTLEMIANNGSSDIFYDPEGPLVKSMIKANNLHGGVFVGDDFSRYEAIVEKPLTLKINEDIEVFTANGISSGLVLLGGLNLFPKLFTKGDNKPTIVHKMIETMRWMASVRTRLGNGNKHYQEMIDLYTLKEWAEDIVNHKFSNNRTFGWEHYDPLYEMTEPHGTSHFSILDENNNSIGMTTTVNLLFGSLVYASDTGIILNNEMDDFSTKQFNNSFDLQPSKYNLIQPYTRPLSSTAPTIIKNKGTPELLIGAAGGSRITTAIFQAIVRMYYLDYSLLDSIAFPRFHDQLLPNYIFTEDLGMLSNEFKDLDLVGELSSLGHNFKHTGVETAMNGIRRVKGEIQGVSDYWRKQGEADGY